MSTLVIANRYDLRGRGVSVIYGLAGADGQPYLNYTDQNVSRVFKGDEIRIIKNTDLATLVSVSIHLTVDCGSTSFTVLLPRMKVSQGQAAPTHAIGITTIHRSNVVPMFNRGQIDTYSTVNLAGTASVESYP